MTHPPRTDGLPTLPWLTVQHVPVADVSSVRLRVAGDLDADSAGGLTEAVTAVLNDPGPPVVELDLAGVTFIGSSGVRCLLVCRRLAEDAGRRLVLVEPSRVVNRVLEIAGLLQTLEPSDGADLTRDLGGHPAREERPAEVAARSVSLRRAAEEARAHSAEVCGRVLPPPRPTVRATAPEDRRVSGR